MFSFFERLKVKKQIKDSTKKWLEELQRYREMPASELSSLLDADLFSAALARTEGKVDQFEALTDGVNSLQHTQRVFYVTSLYETEVTNGGLCQFFANQSREFAPQIADYLDEISAADHKALFERFVQENKIDVNDLSSFITENVNDYLLQEARYPFDDFSNAYFKLKPIADLLPQYVRAHLSDF